MTTVSIHFDAETRKPIQPEPRDDRPGLCQWFRHGDPENPCLNAAEYLLGMRFTNLKGLDHTLKRRACGRHVGRWADYAVRVLDAWRIKVFKLRQPRQAIDIEEELNAD